MNTILCIPGNWTDRTELVTSIVEKNNGKYILTGTILMDTEADLSFEVEVCEPDDAMREAFKWAGQVTGITDSDLDRIGQHNAVIYLIGETGDTEGAYDIAKAALALLNAGGTGVKVETAGKAFSPQLWRELTEDFEKENLYVMFVMDNIVDEEGSVYSCGMHNLGFKDTIVSGLDFEEAVDLISIFGYFQLIDEPELEENETFSESEDGPLFVILDEPEQPYLDDELFENPYGMWRLERAEE
jgi:hypothetical protein